MLQLNHPGLLLNRDKVMITNVVTGVNQAGIQLPGAKEVVIVFHSARGEFLEGEERNGLMKIVNACKLTEEDVMLVNAAYAKNISFSWLKNSLKARVIIVFGNVSLSHNINLRTYQAYTIDGVKIVKSEELTKLLTTQSDKVALWGQLKKIFGI